MANVEWNIPFTLKTPQGQLDLNAESGNRYLLVPAKCSMQVDSLRVTTRDVPAGDGGIPGKTWRSFYSVKLGLQYWIGDSVESSVIACGSDRRAMHDELMLHLNSLVRPSDADLAGGNAQLFWTPTGDSSVDDRLVNRLTLVSYGPAVDDGEGAVEVDFEFRSEYPYAMDKTEITTSVESDGSNVFTLTNPGTADFYPVFKVYGEFESFALTNVTLGLDLNYDGVQPGAQDVGPGDYAEVDTFRETIFLNGNGANLEAGIDIPSSDYWYLAPGDNEIEFVSPGGSLDILWQAAWF